MDIGGIKGMGIGGIKGAGRAKPCDTARRWGRATRGCTATTTRRCGRSSDARERARRRGARGAACGCIGRGGGYSLAAI
jgi:hypothetical protein